MSLHLARAASLCARQPARRLFTSASTTLPLSYDLHAPPANAKGPGDQHPIVFMHGFFGSKKNNRGISK
ncbi:hypothetical protein IMZ48_07720 [Candidatus Bathyarchaeota archaeon]|nr:hypothetical protein [Candidatus Bathyarchaeota archaeon]